MTKIELKKIEIMITKIFTGYEEVWNRLFILYDTNTIFVNGKKKSLRKAKNILKNNISKSKKIVGREIKKKLPFYKGDYEYFRESNGSESSPIYRIYKYKFYIDILD